ncbi:MAG TPA: DUF3383 domain-containing protein, partial [Rhizomicrobium sp.]
MTAGLQVSRLIQVGVNLEPAAAQFPSVTSCMIIGDSNVINVMQRYRSYSNIADVATDFGTNAPEYLAAVLFFGQNPQPQQLYIGRWARVATAGLLIGGILTPTQALIGAWSGIANGSFHITEDGTGAISVTICDFTAAGNLNAVATEINTRLAAAGATATCAWSAATNQFTFTSGTTGGASTVAYLTAGAGGTDISAQLKGTLATGATEVNGIAAETALAALILLDDMLQFYMVTYASSAEPDQASDLAIAAYVEADATPHIFAITVQDTAALDAASTEDIGYQLHVLDYLRTCYQYSSTNAYAICSMLGRAATVDFEAQNSTITLMFKSEPGVTPEVLTGSQADALNDKNYSYYATFNNGIPIIVNGTMAATDFYFDDIQGTDALVAQIQTDMFNVLHQTPTKIPQTDAGTHVLTTTASGSCAVFLNNGQLGPGVWTFNGVGAVAKGDYLEKGYYVFAPSIASQSPADRLARKSVPITIL